MKVVCIFTTQIHSIAVKLTVKGTRYIQTTFLTLSGVNVLLLIATTERGLSILMWPQLA